MKDNRKICLIPVRGDPVWQGDSDKPVHLPVFEALYRLQHELTLAYVLKDRYHTIEVVKDDGDGVKIHIYGPSQAG